MKFVLAGLAILGFATPAAAETWHAFSRSANSAYMADVDSIVVEGEVTRVSLAIVPLRGEAVANATLTQLTPLFQGQLPRTLGGASRPANL